MQQWAQTGHLTLSVRLQGRAGVPYDRLADFAAIRHLNKLHYMKHSKLHGVAHNYADSLAGGLSFVVPNHALHTNIFAEAAATEEGYLVADFLTGKAHGAFRDGEVEHALPLFRNAFPEFCDKHNVDVSDYKALLVRYVAGSEGNSYVITVDDKNGKRTSREYVGSAGKRSENLDELGKRRPKILSRPLD